MMNRCDDKDKKSPGLRIAKPEKIVERPHGEALFVNFIRTLEKFPA